MTAPELRRAALLAETTEDRATTGDSVVIPWTDSDGQEWGTIYPVDTDEEIAEAKVAMREEGVEELPILRGDGPDQIETSLRLIA